MDTVVQLPQFRNWPTVARRLALCAVLAATASVASAQQVYVSGPSVVSSRGGVAVIRGANFRPNQPLLVVVRLPGGQEAVYNATADAEGKLAYEFTPSVAGSHVLSVGERVTKNMPSLTLVALP
jgi:hypothetical protein